MAFSRHFHLPGGTVRKKLLPFSGWVREDFNFFEIFKQKKTKKKTQGASCTVYRWNIHRNNFFEHFLWKKLLVDDTFFSGGNAEISVDHVWFWYEKWLIKVAYELFVAPGNSLGLFAFAVKKYCSRMKFSMSYWYFFRSPCILTAQTVHIHL